MQGQMGDLLKQAQKMQEEMQKQMQKMQEDLQSAEVVGESGAGLVKVILNGRHDCKRVTIDPSLFAEDREILEDLIAAAFNDGVQKAEKYHQQKLSNMTAGFGLPPGFKMPF